MSLLLLRIQPDTPINTSTEYAENFHVDNNNILYFRTAAIVVAAVHKSQQPSPANVY